MPEHVSIGINAGPLYGAIGILAGILRARDTGEGMQLEVAQSDAAAAFDWYRSESFKAYERPEDEVTGNKSDDYKRRPPGTAGMREGVRYQLYESKDGHVLFMASEQEFWKNFCEGVGRPDLFEANPGSKYADHAIGNRELWAELRDIFRTKTAEQWLAFGGEVNTPIAPVNTPQTIGDDPQFADRLGWIARERLGAEQLPVPLKVVDGELPLPTKAPTVGEHTDLVLTEVLGWGAEKIAELREAGAFGPV
jgi:crotonobetainyl-CoA:carnitine CoA-transferase CaiB-like acyl-CoA transferase